MTDDVIVIPDEDEEWAAPADVIDADPDAELPAAKAAKQPTLPPNATLLDDKSVKLALEYPVTLKFKKGGSTTEEHYSELHMHRLTGAHMQRLANTEEGNARTLVLLTCSTRLSPARVAILFDRMDAADITNASDVLGFLLGTGRKTGR